MSAYIEYSSDEDLAYEQQKRSWPRSWPNLVGDTVERARAVITFQTDYFIEVVPFKGQPRVYMDKEGAEYTPGRRVMLFLDKDGFVARTPVVG